MSAKRYCDACNTPFTPWPRKAIIEVKGMDGSYIGRVSVDVLSATGREDICKLCVCNAVTSVLANEKILIDTST